MSPKSQPNIPTSLPESQHQDPRPPPRISHLVKFPPSGGHLLFACFSLIIVASLSVFLFFLSSRHYLRDSLFDLLFFKVFFSSRQNRWRKWNMESGKLLEISVSIYFYAVHSRDDIIYSLQARLLSLIHANYGIYSLQAPLFSLIHANYRIYSLWPLLFPPEGVGCDTAQARYAMCDLKLNRVCVYPLEAPRERYAEFHTPYHMRLKCLAGQLSV